MWLASGWFVPFAITLLLFKTTPVLKVFCQNRMGCRQLRHGG
jgi:hypothetical protein